MWRCAMKLIRLRRWHFARRKVAPMGRKSSLAITGVHDFTNGVVDEMEARSRWIGLAGYDA